MCYMLIIISSDISSRNWKNLKYAQTCSQNYSLEKRYGIPTWQGGANKYNSYQSFVLLKEKSLGDMLYL